MAAAGFGTAGVAAGSVAATIQSVVYGGTATGLFSAAQSAGVLGVGSMMTAGMGGLGAAFGGATAWLTGAGAAAAAPVAAAGMSTGAVAGVGTAVTTAIVGAGHYLDRKGASKADGTMKTESESDDEDDSSDDNSSDESEYHITDDM